MLTNYSNNVMLQFGSTWRGAVNMLLNCKQRRSALVAQLEAEGKSAPEIKHRCEAQIWGPARRLKESLGTGQPVSTTNEEGVIIQLLWPVLRSYSAGYQFAEQNICYDVKVHPLQHLKAFVQLNMIIAQEKMWFVQALPLRRSWVYSHVPLNTCILVRCIFGEPYKQTPGGKKTIKADINKHWGRAVDLQQDMFQLQKHHQFVGFAMTDGVSISAVCETKEELAETSAKRTCKEPQQPQQEQLAVKRARLSYQPSYLPQLPSVSSSYMSMPAQQPLAQQLPQQTQPVQQQRQADCAYISNLSQATLQSTAGRCVLVDPGHRDLLYMIHEKSTVQEKDVYRYTRCQQRKETRVTKYKKILENEKTAEVAALERTLSAGSYIKPDLKLFEEYLAARAEVAVELTRFYNRTMCRQRVGATTPEVPLHRKLRLSAFINRKRADQLLVNRLRQRFSQDAVFVMGNWSAPMAKFHEPIRSKGWRTLFKRGGFTVYLINEHLTSSFCPICEERISTFLDVPNPRPWMRTKRPEVKCHGLLGCQSQKCMVFFDTYQGDYLGKKKDESEGEKKGDVKRRLWNRDLAAVLNFRNILFSLRETGTVPLRFQRKQQQPTEAPKTRKTRKTTARKTTARKTTARKTPAAPAPNPN
ncbi:hypothetical protein IWW56_002239 [Coemansia sp. RSA 2131]|nr:hypothetical protein IWW56_002239 [Coemansia sp. RSA 2131]